MSSVAGDEGQMVSGSKVDTHRQGVVEFCGRSQAGGSGVSVGRKPRLEKEVKLRSTSG